MLIHVNSEENAKFIASIFWHDSKLLSGTVTKGHQIAYPDSICYGGSSAINMGFIYELYDKRKLALVFAGCSEFSFYMIDNMGLSNTTFSSLWCAKIMDYNGNVVIDCAALLYEVL